jgi:hypothetical protein
VSEPNLQASWNIPDYCPFCQRLAPTVKHCIECDGEPDFILFTADMEGK